MQRLDPARPTVPEVLPLVRALYALPFHGVGGHLHIVLDDGNIEDGSVRFCLDAARGANCAPCAELAEKLLEMSKTQRLRVCAAR
jgi:hypothetical protein